MELILSTSRGLRGQYRLRRDWTIDLLYDHFDIEQETDASHSVFIAYKKSSRAEKHSVDEKGGMKPLFEFAPPSGGMFLWFRVSNLSYDQTLCIYFLPFQFPLQYHRDYDTLVCKSSLSDARTQLSNRLWKGLVDSGVLLRPGFVFQVRSDKERNEAGDTFAYLRLCFATVTVCSWQMTGY